MLNGAGIAFTIVLYAATSLFLFAFGLNLLALSRRVIRKGPAQNSSVAAPTDDGELPVVTVQLPVFNELYVAERLIDACTRFDYPADKLQIQVLDDSTDETSAIVASACARARVDGIWIDHVQRSDRLGYKAGALAAGLDSAAGEFVAIFDADFVPPTDFLRRALGHFDADDVAFVQARWGHLNRDHSWLTRLQALAIDAHFLVEQAGRGIAGHWFNFNGTCGMWRREAIDDAGGWAADTLTEDLDLSYRAHLAGWTARFAEEIVVPGEVPAQLTGFRRQQHRWARGSIECARRLLPQVWRTEQPLPIKLQATLHLCSYFIQLLLLLLVAIYPAVVWVGVQDPRLSTMFGVGYVLVLTSFAPTVFFVTGSWRSGRSVLRDIPQILAIGIVGAGLMVNTARAAIEIFTRPDPAFERTPKFGLSTDEAASSGGSGWRRKRYQIRADRIVVFEIAVGLYALVTAWLARQFENLGVTIYAGIFGSGVLIVAVATIVQSLTVRAGRGRRRLPDRGRREQPALSS